MSKENTAQQANQSKPHVNKPAQTEMSRLETAVVNPIHNLQRAYTNPHNLTTANAKTLQRTIGNQALRRLSIQRKMTVGPVGDKYEQEADAVAKQVVSQLHASKTETSSAATAQRQEEEELQMKPLVQRQEEEELQAKGDPTLTGGDLSGDIESAVQSAKSGGQPLGYNVRAPMEQAFGADFSSVKVHTGGKSDILNRSLSARAFTSGHDVFFRSGEYNPGSRSGQELLAHELTHTIQQGAAPSKTTTRSSADGIQRALYPAWKLDTKASLSTWQAKISELSQLGDGWAEADQLYELSEFLFELMGDKLAYERVDGNPMPQDITPDQKAAWQILDLFDTGAAKAATPKAATAPIDLDESWMEPSPSSKKSKSANKQPQKAKKKSPAQKQQEKQEKLAREKLEQEKSAQAAQQLIEKQKLAAETAAQAEIDERHANAYWEQIQGMGAGSADNVSAPLQFLIFKKFIKLENPHRAFLSRYEKGNNGQRKDNRFGLSAIMTPSAKINNPGPKLVLHMHCNGKGKVLSAGIKYYQGERQAGANVVMENMHFLQLDFGIDGDNVESEVGAFD